MKRKLGRSGIEVSALGMGCWAIGGPWTFNGSPAGWGDVNDAQSLRALHRAMDLGVNFFDTAANYGCGHSESVLGKAIQSRRSSVIVATKFGYRIDPLKRDVRTYDDDEENGDVASRVRIEVEGSLQRLMTDYIDLYQLHTWGLSDSRASAVREELEQLILQGKIRCYGWSTDRVDAVRHFSRSPHCAAAQQQFSVLDGNANLLALCEEIGLASICRAPLGMGSLTGKFDLTSTFGSKDVRRHAAWHPAFRDGRPHREWLNTLETIRAVLTSDGRTLAQGAIAWLWARSECIIPIPGFRNEQQVEENCRALDFGPLSPAQMQSIDQLRPWLGCWDNE